MATKEKRANAGTVATSKSSGKSPLARASGPAGDPAYARLCQLLEARGPSGFEDSVQHVFLQQARETGAETGVDVYGNVWAAIGPKEAPAVLVMGHGDEIGLMIHYIDEKGLCRVRAVGGVDPQTIIARRAYFHTGTGERGELMGVIGAVPIHLQDREKKSVPKLDDLFIDFGFSSKEEATKAGIRVGCTGTLVEGPVQVQNGRIVARALDNRIGVFSALETLRHLAGKKLRVRVVAVSTVQEEIGAIGAMMVAREWQPVAALVVDVTHATDVPGISTSVHGDVRLGGGPSVTHGSANHRGLLQLLEKAADGAKIPLQHEASSRRTGTDADSVYNRGTGIASAVVSLPNRYMHTTAEMIDWQDLMQLVQLLTESLLAIKPENWGTQLTGLSVNT